jgi:hypothetical protein
MNCVGGNIVKHCLIHNMTLKYNISYAMLFGDVMKICRKIRGRESTWEI